MKEILLNIESKEKRLAIMKHGKLQDLVIERKSSELLTGNIYRGKVTNILQNIQSAFIDIGEGENGFIHISDIIENTQKFKEMFDMDFEANKPTSKKKQGKDADIASFMKIDHPVLVQVVKEPIGSKGARLTSNISIAGRYLVLLPNTPHRGVSRKIQDRNSRERLKRTIRSFEMPQEMGLICRTASMNASTEELVQEAHELLETWENVQKGFTANNRPVCLHRESDLVKKALLTAIDKKFDRLLVDNYKTHQVLKKLAKKFMADDSLSIEYYRDKTPIYSRFNVEGDIEKALRRKIWLGSGGYLYFDKTEAMCTVDVNSGRSGKKEKKTDLEESLVQINMEAAEEIARQLRLRNIGGLIICDFIDMRARKNQRRVLDRLKEAMKDDSARCTILGMSEFGLVEMTRQRSRESLHQTLFTHCPYCNGRGTIKNHESLSIEVERLLKVLSHQSTPGDINLTVHPEVEKYLLHTDKEHILKVAKKLKLDLNIKSKDILHLNEFEFHSNGKIIEV